jgi:phosphatidylglycerophosphate synthase
LKWIPNGLSILRGVLAFWFPFLPEHLRVPVVVVALLSEYLDGALARAFNWVTPSGQILDGVADKLFALSVGLTFAFSGKLIWPFLALIIARDLVVATGFIVLTILRKRPRIDEMKPNLFGKLTTVFQYAVFFDLLFSEAVHPWLVFITGGVSIVAGGVYILNTASNGK